MSFKGGDPKHEIYVNERLASCSCGWRLAAGTYRDAETAAGKHFFETRPKPSAFRAVCRQGSWVPLDEVLSWPREQQPDTTHTRWDSKLKCEVAAVPCTLDTTDRAVFETHMVEVHGKKPTMTPYPDQSTRSLSNRARGKWTTPKAPAEHVPAKPSLKDIAKAIETCPSCGLVAEIRGVGFGRNADELWWREHLRGCALALEQAS